MVSSTSGDRPGEDGSGGKVLRWAAFAIYCLLVTEGLLWIATATIPSVAIRLSNRRAESRFLPDERLGLVGNPRWAEHDARGYRNEEALDHARIVTLGDSQTWGVNASREETWPKQLQAILGAPVYNMAVGASGPAYYHHLIEDALALSPQWIVTGFYSGNDLWDAESDYYLRDFPGLATDEPRDPVVTRAVRERERFILEEYHEAAELLEFRPPRDTVPRPPANTWISKVFGLAREHSRLWGVVRAIRTGLAARLESGTTRSGERFNRRHWNQLVETARDDPGLIAYRNGKIRTMLHPGHRIHGVDVADSPLLEEGLEISLDLLRRIDRRAALRGARHLVVLIPSKEYVYAPFVEAGRGGTILPSLVAGEDEIWRRTRAYLEAEDIEYVDTTPALRGAVERGIPIYPYSTQSHPNAHGYRVIAKAVAARMREHGL